MRVGILASHSITLVGQVPDARTADNLRNQAGLLVGADKVFDNLTINPAVAPQSQERLVINQGLNFETSSAAVDPACDHLLELAAKAAKENPKSTLRIVGHADSTGPDWINQPLSEERAKSVADSLVERGVPREQVTTAGYSSRQPVADNNSYEGRRLNRRVEVEVVVVLKPKN